MTSTSSTTTTRFASTGTCPAEWRKWWQAEGTDWQSLISLHCAIVDRLRASSSWWRQ